MSPKRKKLLLAAVSAVVLSLTSVLVAWVFAPTLLTVDSGAVQAGAIIVLGGGVQDRGGRAGDLMAEVAPMWFIVSGRSDRDEIQAVLVARGVPTNQIVQTHATSTFENATSSVAVLRERNVTNAVIVTSWYHSRRALACFRKAAPDITFYSRPTAPPAGGRWWPNQYERPALNQEYSKLLYYWFVHGVPPWV